MDREAVKTTVSWSARRGLRRMVNVFQQSSRARTIQAQARTPSSSPSLSMSRSPCLRHMFPPVPRPGRSTKGKLPQKVVLCYSVLTRRTWYKYLLRTEYTHMQSLFGGNSDGTLPPRGFGGTRQGKTTMGTPWGWPYKRTARAS